MKEPVSYNRGFADGIFRRESQNPYVNYTHNWTHYNSGYIYGRIKNTEMQIDLLGRQADE